MASKEMQAYLKLLAPKVADQVKVVTPKEIGVDLLLHISTNAKINNFVPMVSQRTMADEDRTVPRICTASNIIGCMKGYQNHINDFEQQEPLTVYGIAYEEALIPSEKLLPDVKETDEAWLVTYNSKTRMYPAKRIGELFISSVRYFAGSSKYSMEIYGLVEVPFMLAVGTTLSVGYHRFTLWYDVNKIASKHGVQDTTPISKTEYLAAKKAGGIKSKPYPPSSKW